MTVLPLSLQNSGGAWLPHLQLFLKRKETDFPLPNERVLLAVPLPLPDWPLMWYMNNRQASTYLRLIQIPDWVRGVRGESCHSPVQQLALMGSTLLPSLRALQEAR